MTTVQGPDGALLEALWQGGGVGDAHRQPVLICPPHPRLGGSMDSAVLAELVWSLGRRRHPTLRFNHRGVGASQGAVGLPPLPCAADVIVDLGPLVDDAAAALSHLLATTGARSAAVIGVSVGALVAARLLASHDGVDRAVLVAPPDDAVGPSAALDAAGLTAALDAGCSVAVVVGAEDRVVDAARLGERLGRRGTRAPRLPLHVVPSADHLFQRGLAALAQVTLAALGSDDDVM